MAAQGAARNACAALGGDLVAYPSFEAQHRVERYFAKQVPLHSYWWVHLCRRRSWSRRRPAHLPAGGDACGLPPACPRRAALSLRLDGTAAPASPPCRLGLQRPDSASEYAWLDGSPVEQGVVSDSAYPHWAWLQPQLSSASGADCVAAWSSYQYERFLGDSTSSSQVQDARMYQTNSADRLFAWGAQPCGVRFATICAVPASSFPCYPPPSPPPPPPQPPSPPTPPLQPSCAPRTTASFYCDAALGLCYNYTATAAFFGKAREACQQQGGELVKYDSGDKQLRVERFFKRFGTLTGSMYWHGISRASRGESLLFSADEAEVLSLAGEEPYAHW
jgi:hypothetical protein